MNLLNDKNKQLNSLLEICGCLNAIDTSRLSSKGVAPCSQVDIKVKPIPAPRKHIKPKRNKPCDDDKPRDDSETIRLKTPILVISDSQPKEIDLTHKIPGVKVEIRPVAGKINKATDYVQDHISPEVPLIIHTGANNLTRESSNTVKLRFQRLEANLKAKKMKKVAISSVIYRGNENLRSKIKQVNSELKNICFRNGWKLIDNDNIDSSCIATDALHLRNDGLKRLCCNFKNCIEHFFMSVKPNMRM
jgi:hypothetical protein